MDFKTADLCDEYADRLQVAEPVFLDFGGLIAFAGPIVTFKVFEDHAQLQTILAEPGKDRVLVVDGGGSMRCALLDEPLAELAERNGWAGLVINGCVRHSSALAELEIGIKALAVHPLNSLERGGGERDIPLRFAGLHLLPGQFLYADEDGFILAEKALL